MGFKKKNIFWYILTYHFKWKKNISNAINLKCKGTNVKQICAYENLGVQKKKNMNFFFPYL